MRTWRLHKPGLLFVVLGLLLGALFTHFNLARSTETEFSSALSGEYLVVACHDGDTCTLENKPTKIKVRLVGIDAPEVANFKDNASQPLGDDATRYINSLVAKKFIHLKSYGLDPYHRTLGEIFLGTLNINQEMIQKGFAEVYRGRPAKGLDVAAYSTLEEVARTHHIGIWNLKSYQSPSVFRQTRRISGRVH